MLKRIRTLENDFNISLIYWDRGQSVKESFEINLKHNVIKIELKAPQGKPAKRIIPLMKYTFRAIRVLKRERPDIIHASNLDMLLIATIYKKVTNKKTKIVYEVGDLPKYTFVKKSESFKTIIARLLQHIERELISGISKIILTSPYFWDEYFSKFVDKDKYLFIPNAPSKRVFNKYEKRYIMIALQ